MTEIQESIVNTATILPEIATTDSKELIMPPIFFSDNINNLTNVNGKLYFTSYDPDTGVELWSSNGSDTGTELVKDIMAGTDSASASNLFSFQQKLYFTADNGINGNELWTSDGTEEGTKLVKDLWDGGSAYPTNFLTVGDKFYFTAYDQTHGSELWVSNGTSDGTKLVKDIFAGSTEVNDGITPDSTITLPNNAGPTNLVKFQDKVFFVADDGVHGWELWQTDGTSDGTKLVKDIFPGKSTWQDDFGNAGEWVNSSSPMNFLVAGNTLYFTATSSDTGMQLWRTDGTTTNTKLVKNINAYSSLVAIGDQVYFSAEDPATGVELWTTDGTETGTKLVKDLFTGSTTYEWEAGKPTDIVNSSYPNGYININDQIFFTATNKNGSELWVSDGTEQGTKMVKDIFPGEQSFSDPAFPANSYSYPNNSQPYNFVKFQDKLFFTADNGINGYELWQSDGTATGTKLVKDINTTNTGIEGDTNNLGSNPTYLTVVGDELYFKASNEEYGEALWKTDGTTAGTVLVKDVVDHSNYSYIDNVLPVTPIPISLPTIDDKASSNTDATNEEEIIGLTPQTAGATKTADKITGTIADDQIDGGDGNDRINGKKGNDLLKGGKDKDVLIGGTGNDQIEGGLGNDKLIGGYGKDILNGGDGNDVLRGQQGEDILIGGAGDDLLIGGLGKDTFVLTDNWGSDRIRQFNDGKDLIQLPDGVTFTDLEITKQGKNTLISFGEDRLTLVNTKLRLITEADFIS